MDFSKKNHEHLNKHRRYVSKTTLKFLASGLMALALSITSCTKDSVTGDIGPKGEQGIQGEKGDKGEPGEDGTAQGIPGEKGNTGEPGVDGTNGQDGADGTNGIDGEDGNANVRAFIYDLTSFSGDSHDQKIPELTQEVLDNDVVLGYLKHSISYYPIPTTNLKIGAAGEDVDIRIELVPKYYTMDFFSSERNLSWSVNRGTLKSLKVVIIESSSVTTGKSAKTETLSKLKSEGIDVSDYDQVMDYFGLEK